MRVVVSQRAGENERYAPGFLADQVGKQVPVNLPGQMRSAPGTLRWVVVAEDGSEARLTFDVPDEHWPRRLGGAVRGMSLGFQAP